mmetsp:Transcript_13130/g.38721  ORF Transcript_13130/g.38721 Transcript_13130/m.38721 type:complete len:95 (-) Transcript_13130:389-673(-)
MQSSQNPPLVSPDWPSVSAQRKERSTLLLSCMYHRRLFPSKSCLRPTAQVSLQRTRRWLLTSSPTCAAGFNASGRPSAGLVGGQQSSAIAVDRP